MILVKRTNSDHVDFQKLVNELDIDLEGYYKEEQAFYDKLNTIEKIEHAIIAYDDKERPVGCGGIKPFSKNEIEIKRMYVHPTYRGNGIATIILNALETWSKELKFDTCILETLKEKQYAIGFYKKNEYKITPNFGAYIKAENSVCFKKELK